MRTDEVVKALQLPEECLRDVRVPKGKLVEQGGFTAADHRRLRDGIEELRWVAVVKSTVVGIRGHDDGVRCVPELQVMALELRAGAAAARVNELVHRVFPLPLILVTATGSEEGAGPIVSMALKRRSQGQAERAVLDGDVLSAQLAASGPATSELEQMFLRELAMGKQPQTDLLALYQGWMDHILALLAARVTGVFKASGTVEQAKERRSALEEMSKLELDLARLRSRARKERQTSRQVDLNLEIKRLQVRLVEAKSKL
ncbi:DUF4391 domain-containing protein [Streptomyces halstedii]|uniref:DUF4391 domain-containing protein n=1 Tax=Streptomyces halstedii TaxID=1944 RepID=UPI0037ABDFAD